MPFVLFLISFSKRLCHRKHRSLLANVEWLFFPIIIENQQWIPTALCAILPRKHWCYCKSSLVIYFQKWFCELSNKILWFGAVTSCGIVLSKVCINNLNTIAYLTVYKKWTCNAIQREFHIKFNCDPQTDIWTLVDIGCLCKGKSTERPRNVYGRLVVI